MRIGLTVWSRTIDGVVEQAKHAEADGFSSVWLASSVTGDPLVAMAIAGRETSTIELGTAVLQTYPCHPLLQANRIAATANALGRPGLTIGIGPSHSEVIEGTYGMSFDHPGNNTREYLSILTRLLDGQAVDFDGDHWSTHTGPGSMAPLEHPVPLLLSALGPRLLRTAGEYANGTITWLATAEVIEHHVSPRIRAAAAAAGRPDPRIVVGLPVAVHDDIDEARAAQTGPAKLYGSRQIYRRVVEMAGAASAAETAIVGDEASVTAQLQSLLDAGATDIHAAIFPAGDDPRSSMRRTRELLASLAT